MRTLTLPLLLAACISSIATSDPGSEGVESDMVLLSLSEATAAEVQIERQGLGLGLGLNCEHLATNPSVLADSDLWSSPRTVSLQPGIPVSVRVEPWNDHAECHVARVTHPDFGTRILFWFDRPIVWHELPVEDVSTLGGGTILFGDQPGQQFSDGGAGVLFDNAHDLPECEQSRSLDWSSPGNGEWTLGEPERLGDCTTWLAANDTDTKILEVCAPESLLLRPDGTSFRAGDRVDLYADDTAFRMTQVGGKELELILTTDVSRPPYAIQLSDGHAEPHCVTHHFGVNLGATLDVATPFDGPTALELDTPTYVQLTAARSGQVVLDRYIVALNFPDEAPAIGIGALSWPHTPLP